MPTLALLDGHSIAYRAFFALPEDLATTSGQVTNAVYGFTRMLIKLLGDHHPDGLVVAWDVGRVTFRTDAYPEYKAQRSAAPDAFKSQLPLIGEVLDSLGVGQLRIEGYEADDVIASFSEQANAQGWDVLIVTGDRDAFQLVDGTRRILYTRRGITDTVIADRDYVIERYGIPPERYVERAAMCGDTSDNLPGVPGVGDKTAAKLLVQYGSLDGIFEHLDELSPKLRENLAAARDQVYLNQRLMTLVRDLDVGMEPEEARRGEWDRAAARELFISLEFHSLWEDLLAVQPGAIAAGQSEVLEAEGRVAGGDEVELPAGRLVLDLVDEGGFQGIVVLEGADTAALVPFDRLGALAGVLADPERPKVAHHAKPLVRRLLDQGVRMEGLSFDTALAAYLINPAARTYDLGEVATKFASIELESPDTEQAAGGAQGAFDFSEGPDLDRAARRVVAIARLAWVLETELEEREELELYRHFELPLVSVLARMEATGIGVDRPYLEGLGAGMRADLEALERGIHEEAGEPFNVNSTDQLAVVLYQKLGLPVLKKTPGGKPSTDAAVLEKLAEQHDSELVRRLLRYREIEKLRSTYVDGYLPLVAADGRIHTTFNQMAATTGRLSSEEPNLQNIPVRSETGRTIRRAFVASPENLFVVADYSQIELRVLAHMSGDPALVEAFRAGLDIHTATAARVFDVAPELVTAEMRRMAKVINFGLLYGMEAFGLATRLGIGRDEAREHIDAYFARFPDVKAYMDGVVAEARRKGYTQTLFGRRRYLPELKSDNFRIRQMGERMALNAPIQGTAADIIKKAMIDLEPALEKAGGQARMLLQIHDELVVETPVAGHEPILDVVRRVMEGVVELAVPLVVDLATGESLAAAKG
jgi:DNA polymerase-1